jgi:hypothetical protein
VIFIDLKHKKPTDSDIPGWTPWSKQQWQAWLDKSAQLVADMAALDAAGKQAARNALIDANQSHWTALKPWLLALSNGKCWFSEVRELYSHPEVEHFRPKTKARRLDGSTHDGYWWLAFDYLNFRICGNVGNRKKGVWFPLQPGTPCSTSAKPCEESETRYLLDPINAYDVGLLAFDEEGKVAPAADTSEWEQQRVAETIKRLKLNQHVPLAEERRKVWNKVDGLIQDYIYYKSRCKGDNQVAEAMVNELCQRIREMTRPAAELSAVAHSCVALRNDPRLSRLLGG